MKAMRWAAGVAVGLTVGAALVASPAWADPDGVNSVRGLAPGQWLPRAADGKLLVYVDGPQEAALRDSVTASGGRVVLAGPGRVQAAIAAEEVDKLAGRPGVRHVHVPDRAVSTATRSHGSAAAASPVISEGVSAAQAQLWHQQGKKGVGVKIGIIDTGFGGLREVQQTGELPPDNRLVVNDANCLDATAGRSASGTAAAEVVFDMAPDATLYLACTDNAMGFAAAASWLQQQGAQIITSEVAFLSQAASRGDGTGDPQDPNSPADVVRRLRQAGVMWVLAAGNFRNRHFAGTAVDRDNDRWVEYSGSIENNGFTVDAGQWVTAGLRWDAWPRTNDDLDLYVMKQPHAPSSEQDPDIKAMKTTHQKDVAGGLEPREELAFENTEGDARAYWVYVKNNNVQPTLPFDLFVAGGGQLGIPLAAGSVAEPASSAYAVAVSAAEPGAGVEDYSGEGPTIDKRIKPDVTGYDKVSTKVFGPAVNGETAFAGTAAAAAHLAGGAAVLKSANTGLDAAQLETVLKTRARRAMVGNVEQVDNRHGYGFLDLGQPDKVPAVVGSGYTAMAQPNRVWELDKPCPANGELVTAFLPPRFDDTTAVALNVTADSDAPAAIDLFPTDPAGSSANRATTLKSRADGLTAVSTVATLGADRQVWVRIRCGPGRVWVAMDLVGHFGRGGAGKYYAEPVAWRALDTRDGAGSPLKARSSRVVPVHDKGLGPNHPHATAVAVNLTAMEATEETHLIAYGQDLPSMSTLNLRDGDRRSNLAIVPIGEDGNIRVYNHAGSVNITIDVLGWFDQGQTGDGGARYVPLGEPKRIVDTTEGTGLRKGELGQGEVASFDVGAHLSDRSATGAVFTTTVSDDLLDSQVSVYPSERSWAPSTDIGVRQGETMAGLSMVPLGASGQVDVRNEHGNAQVRIDALGYFTEGTRVAGPAGSCLAQKGESGFTPMFDGRAETSGGWIANGQLPDVTGCELSAGGSGATWFTAGTYQSSYTLRLDWKATSDTADSGVYLALPHQALGSNPSGPEVQIGPRNASGDKQTGAVVGVKAPTAVPVNPVGQWNTFEITLDWNRVTVTLNGQLVNDATVDPASIDAQRYVGLQNAGANPVRFRNIRVKRNARTGVGAFAGSGGICLDQLGNPDTNRVHAFQCMSERPNVPILNQTWTLPGDGTIRNANKCLDVAGGGTANGTEVVLADCGGGASQQWLVRGDATLDTVINAASGKCLNATGSANGDRLTIEPCAGRAATTWALRNSPTAVAYPASTSAVRNESGRCLDVEGANPKGSNLWLWDCYGGLAQTWTVVGDGTVRAYSRCLDVEGAGTAEGTRVGLYDCNGTIAQRWQVLPNGNLINPNSKLCAAADSGDQTARISLRRCDAPALRTWHLSAQIASRGTVGGWVTGRSGGTCLDVLNADPNLGTVQMWSCNNSVAQQWEFMADGTIQAMGRCLDVRNFGTADGSPVQLFTCNHSVAQKWVRRSDGHLVNPNAGKCLDVAGNNTMTIYACHGGLNQRWSPAARPSG